MLIRKACTRQDLESVWRLTHDLFVAEGYAQPNSSGMLRHYPHLDLIPQTTVLLAEDETGRLLGSNSYTLDGPAGLHVDDDFRDVVDPIREECRRSGSQLSASWRILTVPDCRSQLNVVLQLISATLESALRQRVTGSVLYLFNPRHEGFYARMLGLRTLAGPRFGNSVNQAPAILMRGEISEMSVKWASVGSRRSSARLPALARES